MTYAFILYGHIQLMHTVVVQWTMDGKLRVCIK